MLAEGNNTFRFSEYAKSAEASRFDAAHELGHLVLHRHGTNKGKEIESEANAFASAFLMPYQSILAHGWSVSSVKDVIRAKKIWNVSAMALAYRLHKTGVLSEWVYRSMCIELSTMGLGLKSLNCLREKPLRCFRRFSALLGILGAPHWNRKRAECVCG